MLNCITAKFNVVDIHISFMQWCVFRRTFLTRGISSSGRALDLHSRGTGIDTRILHFSAIAETEKISSATHSHVACGCIFLFINLLSYGCEKMPRPGIEPGTFRSSVWRSPNWAISAVYVVLFIFASWLLNLLKHELKTFHSNKHCRIDYLT